MSVDLSIIIVNFHTEDLTKACIKSIKDNTKKLKYEIIVVDSESDGKLKKSSDYKLLISKDNLGFTGGNNLGIKGVKGKYILLLNSDTLIYDDVLPEMISWMDRNPKIGISSCALKNKDGSIQPTGGYFPTLLRVFSWMTIQDLPFVDMLISPFHPKAGFYTSKMELDWVTGAFMLIKKEVIDQVGGLDNDYFMYTEDTDFCYKAKEKGWGVIYNPKWSITHFGGASSAKEFPILTEFKSVKLFYKKHYPSWQYPVLRFLLKLGSLWRIVIINKEIYAEAFKEA